MSEPPRRPGVDGVILYDKPAGITSHDVVARVRRTFARGVKVGHAGTLDPFATGLLLVLVGRATRTQRFLMALPKTYLATARFGVLSTTGDPDGVLTETGEVPTGELSLPTGRLRQRPPAYSAVKIGGRRAYALARAGETVEIPEREVEVHRFEQLWHEGARRGFCIECSSGTYVRSLVMDLGDAFCETLRRTRIGPFDVAAADPERIVPLELALGFLPAVELRADDARRAAHGIAVAGEAAGPVRLRDAAGLLAIAEPRDGRLHPVVGLRPALAAASVAPDGAATVRRRMQVTNLKDAEARPRRVAVGEFDGVHLGHREVIAGSDTVLTFEPHPLQVVRPEAAPKLLNTLERKAELIAELGVQELVVIPFDDGFAHQSPQRFLDEILVARLGARHVSVGANFRFGHRAAGDSALLESDDRFETRVVPMVELDGEIVSSSHIRALVLAGELDVAARFLGRPFQLRGEVVSGDRRGRTLGFPTANIVPDEALVCPGHGVYACRADGVPAAVSIGVRPTFATGRGVLVEAYLLDRDVDLYGRRLRIEFIARLRGERRFDTVAALVQQMHADVEATRRLVG